MALLPVVFVGWGTLILAAGIEAGLRAAREGRTPWTIRPGVSRARSPGCEHVSIAFGLQFSSGPDPLFARRFILATSVNSFPVALGGEPFKVLLIGIGPFALVYRVRKAQAFNATQRAEDLKNFETLRVTLTAPSIDLQERTAEAPRPTE